MTPTDTFQTHRPRLFALAYRLLGSRSDAEDIVQDAWLRWQGADTGVIRDPEGWLVTATTRLGLDRLRALRSARVEYVGPWLPEPLEIALDPDPLQDPAQRHALADEVSVAFLALLEQLKPDERAAFLLKDVFDYDYPDIAPLLEHSPANCRQLVHRARQRLQTGAPRFTVSPAQHRDLLARFMAASQQGDLEAIRALLGAERIAQLYWAIARRNGQHPAQLGQVNGEPAILRFAGDQLHSVTMITVDAGRIVRVLSVLNPEKLTGLVTARDAGASF
ncbi:sigma-70 family RNA polymerase sigma factor [Stenotrophomonas sp. RG-453]|uniref:sigma-70 family RNA polymerase sigma factor n=1 Tax=Stenotrophomonas sp. RG-453 TaxID=2957502 RepID=UPI0029CA7DD7|nr:sigma-70 family RNA polymerase sigma factor [Stenotrophomonas sp. RG-453]MDX5516002.1 sigma-70 family RNA polymerase sigma factor [Stenotrophomonas sp. RG-453]